MTEQKLKNLLVGLLLIATTSCSFTNGKGLAETGVVEFHNQYNSAQFHAIYNQADEGFRVPPRW